MASAEFAQSGTVHARPCPFCGGKAVVSNENDPFRLGVQHADGIPWVTIGCSACCYFLTAANVPRTADHSWTRRLALFDLWNGVYADFPIRKEES